jgi:hypothetical protein
MTARVEAYFRFRESAELAQRERLTNGGYVESPSKMPCQNVKPAHRL